MRLRELLRFGPVVMAMLVVAFTSAHAGKAKSRLVYAVANGAAYDIRIMDPDGGNDEVVLADGKKNREPAWCAGKIVYSSNKDGSFDIWIMNQDGSDATNLTGSVSTGNETQPDCSSDINPTVAFISDMDGNDGDLYTIPSVGGSITQLTDNDVYTNSPSWCGSSKIAYVEHAGNSPGHCGDQIWVMKADGTGAVQQTCIATEWVQRAPDCSPDGTELVFAASDATVIFGGQCNPIQFDIYRIEICSEPPASGCCFDLNADVRLASHPGFDDAPTWSTDGGYVYFRSDREVGTVDIEIYKILSNGNEWDPEQLTFTASSEDHPNAGAVKPPKR